MLELCNPTTRHMLVDAKISAMSDGIQKAFQILNNKLISENSDLDRLAINLLKSELYYLDYQGIESQKIFKNSILPFLDIYEPKNALLLSDNGMTIAMSLASPEISDFYHLLDQRKALNIKIVDSDIAIQITEASNNGRHYDALPLCWKILMSSYNSQNWHQIYNSELKIAKEYFEIHDWYNAAYHGMMSCDTKFMVKLANKILENNLGNIAEEIASKLLPISSLRRHSICLLNLINKLADIFPESIIESISQYLIKSSKQNDTGPAGPSYFESVWKAIDSIAFRLDGKISKELINIATGHDIYKNGTIRRSCLIDALCSLISNVDQETVESKVDSFLSIATDSTMKHDFRNIVKLLCIVSDKVSGSTRQRMKDALFPPNSESVNTILYNVKEKFGNIEPKRDSLNSFTDQLIRKISLQVEIIPAGLTPEKHGEVFNIASPIENDEKQLVVRYGLGMQELYATLKHADLLDESNLKKLTDKIIEMADNDDNSFSNKITLLKQLELVINQLTDKQILKVSEILLSTIKIKTCPTGTDSLSRFNFNTNDFLDFWGQTLQLLVKISCSRINSLKEECQQFLVDAMSNDNCEIKLSGCVASRYMTTISDSWLLLLIICILDENIDVAQASLWALCKNDHIQIPDNHWPFFMTSIEKIAKHKSREIRCSVANLLADFISKKKFPSTYCDRTSKLKSIFETDVSCYVRNSITK